MARSTVYGEQGYALMKLLVKAAGLEGKPVRKLVVTLERSACITFDAVLNAEEENIKDALDAPRAKLTEVIYPVRADYEGEIDAHSTP